MNIDNMQDAMKLAETLAKSGLVPVPVRNKPADVLVILLTGRELGLSPMLALRSIHVVEGRPTLSADLMVALCVGKRDVCARFQQTESTPKRATYIAQRVGGEPVTLTWTWEMATAAGVTVKQNWKNYPDAMLRARCKSALARDVFPDLMAGLYDPEELGADQGQSHVMPAPAIERPALGAPAPRETLEARVGERECVVVDARAEKVAVPRMTLEEAQSAPPGSFPRGEVIITDLPPREPGSDDGGDDIENESLAIVHACETVADMEAYRAIAKRGMALPKGSEATRRASGALRRAHARLTVPGGTT